jgi:hypothetical protein
VGIKIRTKYVGGNSSSPDRQGTATAKSRNSKHNTTSNVTKVMPQIKSEEGVIRLPSMAKCLQFKILPKDSNVIKDFFNMRIMNQTPISSSALSSGTPGA